MPEKRSSRRLPRQPSYRLHRARGYAVVTINGKNHYLGPYSSPESQEKHARLIARWRANGKELSGLTDSTPNRDLTISGLILNYLDFAAGYYKDFGSKHRGKNCNLRYAVRSLRILYGRIYSSDFSPEALENVRQSMIDAGLARSTINQRVTRIKRVFRWGARKCLVLPSVYHGLRAVEGLKHSRTAARETEPVKPAPKEHLDATRPCLNKRVRAMVEIQELTGMRPQDIRNLRGYDLDMAGEVWVYRPFTHKNEHLGLIRRIAIGPRAQGILKPFLKPDAQQCFVFSPREAAATVRAERGKKRKTPRTPSESKRVREPNPKRQPGDQYTKDA
jgi:integrase